MKRKINKKYEYHPYKNRTEDRMFSAQDGMIKVDRLLKCVCHKEHVLLNHEAGTMVWGNEKTN